MSTRSPIHSDTTIAIVDRDHEIEREGERGGDRNGRGMRKDLEKGNIPEKEKKAVESDVVSLQSIKLRSLAASKMFNDLLDGVGLGLC